MIKIFLVEDEIVIRNGIKNCINWEKEGYEFVGEASDGELAYPMIMKEKPDILITDIRMPFMDGLELSKMIKKELPEIKILILSGYNEFDYAKEAIRLGVTEYILKPVSSAKLLESLGEVAKVIRQEREEKELREYYQKEIQENKEQDKYKLFNNLLDGRLNMIEALEQGKRLGINLSAEGYCVVLFKIMTAEHRMDYTDSLVEAQERIEESVEDMGNVLWYRRGIEGWGFIVQGEIGKKLDDRIAMLEETLKQIAETYPELEYFGGIGKQVERMRLLRESYEEAHRAFADRFVKKLNQIVSYEESSVPRDQEKIEYQGLGSMSDNQKLLENFLRSGSVEEVSSFCCAYFESLREDDLKSILLRQYIIMDTFVCIFSFGEKMQIPEKDLKIEVGDVNDSAKYIQTIEDTRAYLETVIEKTLMLRDKMSDCRYSDIIRKARRYTEMNYMSEEISLNTVAASVNMSPSYFSSVFSQEAGQTYIEYLTSVRMEKAKELLQYSSMRISDIGYEVGYKDAHYFSYIFKKTQGCSPKEYRSREKL